ncbi:DUF411 domain-containing protein [Pontivivens insulae]|uniref:CopG family transcriptional regulator n=1 Tax=Pontivivens insulae TaxID=1639689 RepID=A0A2R8AG17_9RHOB|nr:DUF411 domain-containing protein [Pontivivens insulae]RED10631.1 hypothetical protein DFR53_3446 [Pontivivens insulae]SPF31159.1 hypothetical protein POI8812_03510 [Pontivivens insulae]
MNTYRFALALAPALTFAVGTAFLGYASAAHADTQHEAAAHGTMHVTKSPTCGCCGAWVALAREAGYEVEVTDTRDVTSVKLENEVPGSMWGCHTAMIDGYVVEGHVPFEALELLLNDRPDVAGIAVAGMPAGSPGMGYDPQAQYEVMAFGGSAGEGAIYYRAGL